jgi:hypothetical protein
MKLTDTVEAMITQKTASARKLIQSIDWKCVGITRIVQGNGTPQYTTSTPSCDMGVWMIPEIRVIARPTTTEIRRLSKIRVFMCSLPSLIFAAI